MHGLMSTREGATSLTCNGLTWLGRNLGVHRRMVDQGWTRHQLMPFVPTFSAASSVIRGGRYQFARNRSGVAAEHYWMAVMTTIAADRHLPIRLNRGSPPLSSSSPTRSTRTVTERRCRCWPMLCSKRGYQRRWSAGDVGATAGSKCLSIVLYVQGMVVCHTRSWLTCG